MRTVVIALLVLLALSFVSSYSDPVGVVKLNGSDYWLGWNQGYTYMNNTYFNESSGLIQHANLPDRAGDITYNIGLGKKTNGVYSVNGLTEFLGMIKDGTDWQSYYWLSSEKNVSQGGNWFYFKKNNSQGLADDYVRMTTSMYATRRVNGDFYFVRGFYNVDAGHDGLADYLVVHLENGSVLEFLMNNSGWYNVTDGVVDFIINSYDYSYRVYFDHPQVMVYNKTSPALNGDLAFFEHIGNGIIEANVLYSYSNLWIDAACSVTCGAGSTMTVTDNVEFNSIFQYEARTRKCKFNHVNAFGNNCTMSADCTLAVVKNVTTTYAVVNQDLYTLKCNNQTSCEKNVHSMPQNSLYSFEPRGWNTGNATVKCTIGNIYYSPTAQPCETNKTWINISIVNPANNTNLSLLNVNWSILNATYYGNPYKNFSLLVAQNTSVLSNASAVYTDGVWQGNISYNQSFLTCGWWTWEVQACVYTICMRSINGSMNITKDCPVPVVPESLVQKPGGFVPWLMNKDKDVSFWSWTIWSWIVMGVVLAGALAFGVIRRKKKEGDE